jgi:hypothetical protein
MRIPLELTDTIKCLAFCIVLPSIIIILIIIIITCYLLSHALFCLKLKSVVNVLF